MCSKFSLHCLKNECALLEKHMLREGSRYSRMYALSWFQYAKYVLYWSTHFVGIPPWD